MYLLVVFGLAWAIELGPVRATGYGLGRPLLIVWLVAVMFTPAIASLVARLAEKSGFGDAGLRWGRGRYHLVAWLLPFGVSVLAAALTVALGLGTFDPTLGAALPMLPPEQQQAAAEQLRYFGAWAPVVVIAGSLTQGVLITSIATFGEELGWRGYLLPRLLHLGRARAAALVGFIWGVWHAPVIAQGHNYPGHPVAGVFLMIAFCIVWGIILGWLFLASGSVLAPTLGHASMNSPGSVPRAFVAGADPALGHLTGVVGIALAGCVAAWLLLSRRTSHGWTQINTDEATARAP